MINITYIPDDASIAEQIQEDLSQANLRLYNPVLIVLVSPGIATDDDLLLSIERSQQEDHVIVPVVLRSTPIPQTLETYATLDLSGGYDQTQLIRFIKQADTNKGRRINNRHMLLVIGGIVLTMFVISLVSIASGVIAFPVDEYATENAIRDSQIATMVAPQIEQLRPRTTEDALNFESTLEAIRNDDLIPFIVGTATAIPMSIQSTDSARMTQAVATEAAQTQAAGE